jgi:hypothetical protein
MNSSMTKSHPVDAVAGMDRLHLKGCQYFGFEIVLLITKPVDLLSIIPEKYSC